MANDKKLNSAGKTRAKQAKGQEAGPEPKPAKPTTNVRSTTPARSTTSKKAPATTAAKDKAPTQAATEAAAPRSTARRKAPPAIEPTRSKTKTAGRRNASLAATPLSAEEREHMVRMAAYFKAEKRQFAPGYEAQDWAEAEREVDDWLRQQHHR
ncbi:DUF2934 domain-containing protein [Thioalkalicoccus limnaeus]|uniref:DUF2934 domain-containing protein n=1 Tax=Thioalkalicoccus limnaeus TaxID=120681 RepID=A0ABV4B9V3_9GAMM